MLPAPAFQSYGKYTEKPPANGGAQVRPFDGDDVAPGDDPDWLPLLGAVAIITEVRRVDADAAKRILHSAMVDQKVHIRLVELVDGKPDYRPMDFPANLTLDDIDWERSGPENPLRRAAEHSWWPQWIECFRADVESVARVWPADISVLCQADNPAPPSGGGTHRTARGEFEAEQALALQYGKTLDQTTRADALAWLRREKYEISDRGFLYRVWPAARVRAGLSAKAPRGAKKKLKH